MRARSKSVMHDARQGTFFINRRIGLLCCFCLLFYPSCSSYYLSLAKGQLAIINSRVPIKKILQDQKITSNDKEKLQSVLDIKSFAVDRLGLSNTSNFTSFVDLERDAVSWIVIASRKDKLESKLWNFWIVGSFPYKGFFDKKEAEVEKKHLVDQNYDIYVRGTSAYSTLGWFSDPVFSTHLKYDIIDLASLIIHEMVHTTVYFKNFTQFNENIASFIEREGTLSFIESNYGKESRYYQEAIKRFHDEDLFNNWIRKCTEKLNLFYSKQTDINDIVRKRELLFNAFKQDFSKLTLSTDHYRHFKELELNNAVFVHFNTYLEDQGILMKLFLKYQRDYNKFIQFFKNLNKNIDPIHQIKEII